MAMQQDMHTGTPKKRRVLGPCSHILVAANTGSWRMVRPKIDHEACVRCGICAGYCPTACITVDKKADVLEFDWMYCKGCGICANECPKGALEMIPEGSEEGWQ